MLHTWLKESIIPQPQIVDSFLCLDLMYYKTIPTVYITSPDSIRPLKGIGLLQKLVYYLETPNKASKLNPEVLDKCG